MTGVQLAAVAAAEWSASGGWSTGTNTIDLAVGLETTDSAMTPVVDNVAFNYSTSAPNDFDGDGKSDILWYHNLTVR